MLPVSALAGVPRSRIYYPSRAQRSGPLQAFVETARQVMLGEPA